MYKVTLRPHQFEALGRMKNGCILCGGTGSGKSRTALAYYAAQEGLWIRIVNEETDEIFSYEIANGVKDAKMVSDLYIITTARKRDTFDWEKEMAPFLMSTEEKHNLLHNKIVVDSWNNIEKYVDVKEAFFIFDEQRVVGYGKWVKSFLKIAKMNRWILLSATPGDRWIDYCPVFIANGFFKNKTQFNNEHVDFVPFINFPKIRGYFGERRLARLRDSILVDMDFSRHTVQHHEQVEVAYDMNTYKDIVRRRWNIFEDTPIENASEYCNCLRRVVNSDESRQVKILEILEKHPKIIVFYNYDFELDILRSMCEGNGIEYAEWNGHKHQELPTGSKWIYLVQYLAGAEGWNCVNTDTIVFYSQTYSYKTLIQSCGRIDRLNTPFKDLYYYHLVSRSSIDLAIKRALKSKKKFNESRFF